VMAEHESEFFCCFFAGLKRGAPVAGEAAGRR